MQQQQGRAQQADIVSAEYPTAKIAGPDSARVRRQYAQYLDLIWREQDEDLRPLHQTWIQNLLFLSGKQWYRPNAQGIFGPETEVPSWRQRPVSNLTLPFFQTRLAKVTKALPATQVVPASTQPSDMQAAQLGEEILKAKWLELKGSKRWRRACAWRITTGNAGLLPYWNTRTGKMKKLEVQVECPVLGPDGLPMVEPDPDAGLEDVEAMRPVTEVLTVPCNENGEPYIDPVTGRPIPGKKAHVVDEGEIDFRVYSPFQWRVNPEAESDEDVVWFVIGAVRSIRELEREHPELKGRFQAEDVEELERASDVLNGMLATAGDEMRPSPRDRRDQKLPKALEKHYYEKPCEEYPEGRHWVAVGEHLLTEPTGLPDGLWPGLIHMGDVTLPGRYHYMSVMEAVVGLNREYNEKNAKIKEHDNLFIQGKWLVPRTSGIQKGDITSEPGEIVKYTWPYEPKQAEIKPLPAAVYQERERIRADFEQVSGVRNVSQGGTGGGVTAGIAIMQLQEADDTDLGPFLAEGEEAIAELSAYFLRLIKANYDDERMFYAAGPGRRYMVKSFRASDLEGAVDVIPQSGSARPWSEVARQAMLMELATSVPQLFMDPETGQFDANRLARLLQIGGIEAVYEMEDIDVQEALREEEAFSVFGEEDNQLPMVEDWQNTEVHYRQHRRTLVGGEWREWPQAAQDAFLAHFAMTVQQRTRMQQQAALAKAQAEAGVVPGMEPPPGAPEPGGEPELMVDPVGAQANEMEQELLAGAGMAGPGGGIF